MILLLAFETGSRFQMELRLADQFVSPSRVELLLRPSQGRVLSNWTMETWSWVLERCPRSSVAMTPAIIYVSEPGVDPGSSAFQADALTS